ncbi:MAG TPA: carboxypeptidase-like regulatory domain-containing protein, partial [Anaeromyxobacter sp.]
MRRYLPLFAAALAACGAPEHQNPFDPATPVSQQARATLTGSVQLESVNGVPPALEDVRVTVTGPRATVVAWTDPSGVWTAAEVPPGTYTLSASKGGYRSTWVAGLGVTLDQGGTVVTVPGLALLVARGDLTGTVALDVSTVPGFPAFADRSGTIVTLVAGTTTLDSAVTDATGGFRFPGVAAVGTYAIAAGRPNFTSATLYATPQPDATVPGNDLVLALRAGSLSGSVQLWDAVGGGTANPTSDGAQVSIAGTAFNGIAWAPAPYTTPSSGAWSFTALPPGTYGVVVGSTGRTCGSSSSEIVGAGADTNAGAIRCTDAIAPGAVGLGQPLPTGGGISGWVSGTTVTIPVAQAATDGTSPTSNLRGYQ